MKKLFLLFVLLNSIAVLGQEKVQYSYTNEIIIHFKSECTLHTIDSVLKARNLKKLEDGGKNFALVLPNDLKRGIITSSSQIQKILEIKSDLELDTVNIVNASINMEVRFQWK
ncbi:MAG: hypothetical protein LCH54_12695 [Bacteroidetes bacterium]|nr:hypothetical protein [Bacteroidota bacterium]